ncbi:hypothetical protein BD311DRAFT_338714 [Dichomitus squalens]|uniref:Uncharacterized protein n=1 Tax=Dichomitus squalens TaxID=114155 RepID=A0A4Q9N575_9APHY|nr:hypothetical protein BD311DRAFT_338714 [Dichomitus squalens]
MNYPAISSMEVEVSEENVRDVPVIEVIPVSKPLLPDPKTPQRASEVFGFLSRRNTLTIKERDLPPLPQMIITPENTAEPVLQHPEDDLLHPRDTSLGEPTDAIHSANTSHSSTQLTSSDTHSTASHAQIQTATMTKLSTAFAASTTSLNLLINAADSATDCSDNGLPSEVTSNTGAALAASHATGSSLSSSNSTKVPPSKIPRGPRPRPSSTCKRDAPSPVARDEYDNNSYPENQSGSSRSSDNVPQPAEVPARTREAFTNIPQRQHRRATSRSSGRAADALLNDATAAFLRGPDPSSSTGPSSSKEDERKAKPALPSRKRSTKPEHVAQAQGWHKRDKENTPSPPASLSKSAPRRKHAACESGSASPITGTVAMAVATPMRTRMLQVGEPPSPASSSELSPVAREMMNDLRQQRMRARQIERRRGIWVRE